MEWRTLSVRSSSCRWRAKRLGLKRADILINNISGCRGMRADAFSQWLRRLFKIISFPPSSCLHYRERKKTDRESFPLIT